MMNMFSLFGSLNTHLKVKNDDSLLEVIQTSIRYFLFKFLKYIRISKKLKMRDFPEIVFLAKPGCTISEKLFVVGMYDYDGMSFLLDYIQEKDVFFDVGANVGPYSLLLNKKTSEVFAFEGHPATVKSLKNNFRLNGIDDKRAINLAITDHKGTVSFNDKKGSASNSIIEMKNSSLIINSDTVDNLSKIHGIPRFVKIDTEGHELNVIKGMAQSLTTSCIDFISFEANGILKSDELREIYIQLIKHDFIIGNIDYAGKIFYKYDDLGDKSPSGDYRALSLNLVEKIKGDGYIIKIVN